MTTLTASAALSTAPTRLWIGRVLSGLIILFMTVDGAFKVARHPAVLEASEKLGFSTGSIVAIGLCGLVSTLLYAVPRSAPLGAVLLTGYFGGAIATHVRMGDPLFSHTLFPLYLGIVTWLGLWLRDARVQRLARELAAPHEG